jgi:outer membrane biosynthesis protein TonB
MNRYTHSFLLSFGLYFVLFLALLFSSQVVELNSKTVDNSLKVAIYTEEHVSLQPPVEQKEVVIKKQQIVEPTIKPEPKVEKPIEKIIEKTIEKPVQKIVEKVVEKPIEQITKKVEVETKIQQKIETNNHTIVTKQNLPITQTITTQKKVSESISQKVVTTEINLQETLAKKKQYFALVKNTIEKYKYYPQNALRRGIECDMKVKFTISSVGQLVSLELIEGNKIFHNSVKEAIEKSFPLLPPKNILSENEVLSLVISYTIN